MRKRIGVPCSKQLFTVVCWSIPPLFVSDSECVCVCCSCRIAFFCVICTLTSSVPHPPAWNPVSKGVKRIVEMVDEGKNVVCEPCVCIYIYVCVFVFPECGWLLFVWLSLCLVFLYFIIIIAIIHYLVISFMWIFIVVIVYVPEFIFFNSFTIRSNFFPCDIVNCQALVYFVCTK